MRLRMLVFIWIMVIHNHAIAGAPHSGDMTAKSAIAIDAKTGNVLYAKKTILRHPPASTTKIVTGIVAIEMTDRFDRMVVVSKNAASVPLSKIGLHEGDRITVDELLLGSLLKSGNDAAVALAESIAGSEKAFVTLMNKKVKDIGAKNTHFINSTGLPGKGQYTTVSDLVKIMDYAMKNPKFAEIVGTRIAVIEPEGKKVLLRNTNKLLWMYDGATGGKTGYTKVAKHCFVGEASKNGSSVIIALLGSKNLWEDARLLFEKGFDIISRRML
ncbi:MAG: D-alanyl-D-alanine carboxypeptidase family protein [Nitrospirota bacterium]